ncbi:hypothetical protein R1flu_006793 [Riccia fluitans]|uniref:CST complex subunit CTC1 n=1 Tax=Riccia fluitans TaxID=41844 RepID=A0ABD1YX11_9MARC
MVAWRPFLSGNIKRYITVSGLRRKLVITGATKRHQFLLVATRTSLILPVFDPSHIGVREPHISVEKDTGRDSAYGDTTDLGECTRKIECFSKSGCSNYPRVISYAGFVTEVLFQGILLELDKRVWLLLTQQERSHVHGVRIGSMLAVRDAHTITINTPSEKALLLGACLRSHVSVLRFSPLHSSPLKPLHTSSMLLRYLQKVSFSSAFCCFPLFTVFDSFSHWKLSPKIRGNILGQRINGLEEGIILKYVQKVLASDDALERPDYFKEFFDHQHNSCSGGTVAHVSLTKVLSVSSLTEASLQWSRSKTLPTCTGCCTDYSRWLEIKRLSSSLDNSITRREFGHSFISSHELGVTLLGFLQVCQESGQLELMDATGSVCVVVPDLLSSAQVSRIYQVSKFTVIVKESPENSSSTQDGDCDGGLNSSVSWSSPLKGMKAVMHSSQTAKLIVHFYLRDAELVNELNFCNGTEDSFYQRLKRRCLDKEQSKKIGNIMELDLENILNWLMKKESEMWRTTWPTCGLKYLRDSSGLKSRIEFLRVSCKVVAVDLLVFQHDCPVPSITRSSSKTNLCPCMENGVGGWFSPGNTLALTRVVIDDGCGLAHCWALGDAAVSLLRLQMSSLQSELPPNLLARLTEKYGRSQIQFTLIEFMSCLVRRHGKVTLRSEKPYGASTDSSHSLLWCGKESPDSDEQAFMQALVARPCHNQPLVVTLGIILPTAEDGPDSSKSPFECSQSLAHWTGYQHFLSEDIGWPHFFGVKVESAVQLSDIKAACDDVASLLGNEI